MVFVRQPRRRVPRSRPRAARSSCKRGALRTRSAFRGSSFDDRFREVVFLTISFCADDLTNLTTSTHFDTFTVIKSWAARNTQVTYQFTVSSGSRTVKSLSRVVTKTKSLCVSRVVHHRNRGDENRRFLERNASVQQSVNHGSLTVLHRSSAPGPQRVAMRARVGLFMRKGPLMFSPWKVHD